MHVVATSAQITAEVCSGEVPKEVEVDVLPSAVAETSKAPVHDTAVIVGTGVVVVNADGIVFAAKFGIAFVVASVPEVHMPFVAPDASRCCRRRGLEQAVPTMPIKASREPLDGAEDAAQS